MYKHLSPYGTQHVTKYYIGPRTWQPQAHSNEFSGPIEGGGLSSVAEFRDPGNETPRGCINVPLDTFRKIGAARELRPCQQVTSLNPERQKR